MVRVGSGFSFHSVLFSVLDGYTPYGHVVVAVVDSRCGPDRVCHDYHVPSWRGYHFYLASIIVRLVSQICVFVVSAGIPSAVFEVGAEGDVVVQGVGDSGVARASSKAHGTCLNNASAVSHIWGDFWTGFGQMKLSPHTNLGWADMPSCCGPPSRFLGSSGDSQQYSSATHL